MDTVINEENNQSDSEVVKMDFEEQCLICSKWFSSEDMLMDHVESHSKEPKAKKLRENRTIPPKKGPYAKFLVRKKDRDENSEREVYQCPLCWKTFTKRYYFNGHLDGVHKKKLEDFKFAEQCEDCGLWFISDGDLKDHVAKHAKGEVKTKLKLDIFTLIPKRRKDVPKRSVEFDTDGNTLTCTECGSTFTRGGNLNRHMLQQHGIKSTIDRRRKMKEDFVCKICDQMFTRKLNLQRHLLTHCKEENYECHHCGKSFVRKQHIAEHIASVHLMSMTFECPECESCFSRKSHLKEHMTTHVGDKGKYKCKICGKKFGQKTNLATHLKFHEDVRTYPCGKCGMSFVKKQHLQRHKERINH